jgi:hypothetical protein
LSLLHTGRLPDLNVKAVPATVAATVVFVVVMTVERIDLRDGTGVRSIVDVMTVVVSDLDLAADSDGAVLLSRFLSMNRI